MTPACLEPAASLQGPGVGLAERLAHWSESVWRGELARARLKHLSAADRLVVEAMCEGIARQVLGPLAASLQQAEGLPKRIEVARHLFGLADD